MLKTERKGRVAVIKLDRGVINPIDGDLVDRLSDALSEAREDPDVGGIVLASASEKFFSIGFDLPALYDQDRQAIVAFYDRFTHLCLDLYTWPGPTAAAVTAHAIAGGCILALCCDYRFVAEGRTLTGLNEIALGVPVPHLPQLILERLAGARACRQLLDSGELIDAFRQTELGIADRVLPKDQVLAFASREIAELAALPADAYTATKSQRVERVAALVRAQQDGRTATFVHCWFSPEGRKRLGAAREKF
jgi:enoyl-CoA hydratase/carnithine racemase